jgi:hypothetical protein
VLDLRLTKIDRQLVLALMHACGEVQDTMVRAPHAAIARLYNLVWTKFRLRTLASKLNWEAPMGSTWCILFCLREWNADTRPTSSLLDCRSGARKREKRFTINETAIRN